jgi:phenylacetate-CoA ligase
MSLSLKIYNRLPVFLQNVACSWRGRHLLKTRYNADFHRLLAELNESQWWELDKLKEYQNQKVRELMTHVYENVPYYHRVMKERGLTPKDFETAEDLVKMPILTKEIVRHEGNNMVAKNINLHKNAVHCHTSGTTGAGLKFWKSFYANSFQWAIAWRFINRFGIKWREPSLNFGGQTVVPYNQNYPPFWREIRSLNQTYCSTYHLNDRNLDSYVDLIEKKYFAWYVGYPSSMFILANYCKKINHVLTRPPKIIIPGAETLFPMHRELFEKQFKAQSTNQYGMSEGVTNCSRCKKDIFHVDMEIGVCELQKNQDVHQGYTAFFIGTGLQDYVQPFIRYKTNDVATITDDKCTCGINTPCISYIDGRIESFITTPDGRQVGRLDHIFKDITSVREAQLVQKNQDSVIIRIVPDTDFNSRNEQQIINEMTHYLGNNMSFSIEKVINIPKTKSGKHRFVISEITSHLLKELEE